MSKRFIDTELFSDEWFCDLSKDGKLFWVYFITSCDHAGILKLNEKLIKFQTGINTLETVIKELGNSLIRVNKEYVFCPKFLKFQYPDFPKSNVKQQEGAIKILKSHGVWDEEKNSYLTVAKELPNSYDNDNDNDNGNDKKGGKGGKQIFAPPTLEDVIAFAKEKGFPEEIAKKAFEYYSLADWHDSKGNKVKNWKQKINTVWFTDENKSKPELNLPPQKKMSHFEMYNPANSPYTKK